jgi:hypothetical protein
MASKIDVAGIEHRRDAGDLQLPRTTRQTLPNLTTTLRRRQQEQRCQGAHTTARRLAAAGIVVVIPVITKFGSKLLILTTAPRGSARLRPITGIHGAPLPDGRVLMFGSDQLGEQG